MMKVLKFQETLFYQQIMKQQDSLVQDHPFQAAQTLMLEHMILV